MIKRHFKLILVLFVLITGLTCTGLYFAGFSFDFIKDFITKAPTEEELLAKIPAMDTDKYNKFLFSINIDTGNAEGGGEDIKGTGAVEIYKNVSHMYDLDVKFSSKDYKPKTESWSDFNIGKAYEDRGDGWMMTDTKTKESITEFANVLNNRNGKRIFDRSKSSCTISWEFDTDINYLFGSLMSHYTDDMDLSGSGRLSAVFNPKTYEFEYFTVIVSASNSKQAGALLDSIFYWDAANDSKKSLAIPESISSEAYTKETGVKITGGYDDTVNPMAESLIKSYGGAAETVNTDSMASLFWTVKENDMSATINYVKTEDAGKRYGESFNTLSSAYGEPVENTDNGAYFYNASVGELTYATVSGNAYTEITITGPQNVSQGELRKLLITYKSKIEV